MDLEPGSPPWAIPRRRVRGAESCGSKKWTDAVDAMGCISREAGRLTFRFQVVWFAPLVVLSVESAKFTMMPDRLWLFGSFRG